MDPDSSHLYHAPPILCSGSWSLPPGHLLMFSDYDQRDIETPYIDHDFDAVARPSQLNWNFCWFRCVDTKLPEAYVYPRKDRPACVRGSPPGEELELLSRPNTWAVVKIYMYSMIWTRSPATPHHIWMLSDAPVNFNTYPSVSWLCSISGGQKSGQAVEFN